MQCEFVKKRARKGKKYENERKIYRDTETERTKGVRECDRQTHYRHVSAEVCGYLFLPIFLPKKRIIGADEGDDNQQQQM